MDTFNVAIRETNQSSNFFHHCMSTEQEHTQQLNQFISLEIWAWALLLRCDLFRSYCCEHSCFVCVPAFLHLQDHKHLETWLRAIEQSRISANWLQAHVHCPNYHDIRNTHWNNIYSRINNIISAAAENIHIFIRCNRHRAKFTGLAHPQPLAGWTRNGWPVSCAVCGQRRRNIVFIRIFSVRCCLCDPWYPM